MEAAYHLAKDTGYDYNVALVQAPLKHLARLRPSKLEEINSRCISDPSSIPISIIFHLHLLYFHYSSHTCRNLCQNPLEVPGGPGGVHRTHADVPCGRAEPEGTAVLGPRGPGGLRAKFHPTTFQPETSTRNMPRIATVEMPIIPKFQEFRSHPFESRGLRAADELPAQHVLRGGKSRFGSVLDGRPFIGIRQSPFRQVPAHPGLQFRSPTFCRSNC